MPDSAAYRCPGESHAIPRFVHLGRLAESYAACRDCLHRTDTGTLAPSVVRRFAETVRRAEPPPLVHDEHVGGAYPHVFGAEMLAAFAKAFARFAADDVGHRAGRGPTIMLAHDGRLLGPELPAAAAEGLRWSGADVIDAGRDSGAALAWRIAHSGAAGGLLIAAEPARRMTVRVWLYGAGGRPLSRDGGLATVAARHENGVPRPGRSYGALGTAASDEGRPDALRPWFHALRPLRFVLATDSLVARAELTTLLEQVACQAMHVDVPAARTDTGADALAPHVCAAGAHFGVWIDEIGEAARVCDERGAALSAGQLAAVLAPVVDCDAPVSLPSGMSRERAHRESCSRGERLASEPSGRIWFGDNGHARTDAVQATALLLSALSQSDRPLSEIAGRVGD